MAELWGAVLRALGSALSMVYDAIPSYGVAIILVTLIIRALLIPLTLKQIRSMSEMQRIQPELKKLQQKYKGDRQKLNEELMRLYKEHNVNPLGGCFPIFLQAPVFIAFYSVLRAAIVVTAAATLPGGAAVPADMYTPKEAQTTVCRPTSPPRPVGPAPTEIACETEEGKVQRFVLSDFRDRNGQPTQDVGYVSLCRPQVVVEGGKSSIVFVCQSALGTGHLPRGGQLFGDITDDRATFLGMHLQCTATQAGSRQAMRQCTASKESGGGLEAVPYYALIALFIATTYFQSKQMASRATGQMAQQQKMMTRIMPVFLGFISLSIPAGTNVYWVTSNLWTIGQQSFFLRKMPPPPDDAKPAAAGRGPDKGDKDGGSRPSPNGGNPKSKKRKKG